MYIIEYDYIDSSRFVHHQKIEFADKDVANSCYVMFKKNINITNIQTKTEKFITVQVKFNGYDKVYTYLAKKAIKNKYVVVKTQEGLKVVQVVSCTEQSKAELEKVLPFAKYQYIYGEVV